MAAKRKTVTKRTTKKAAPSGVLNMRRVGPRAVAEAILAREATLSGFGRDVVSWMAKLRGDVTEPPRSAQWQSREQHATH